MLRSLVLAFLTLAGPALALDTDETRHLLSRAGFGATAADIREYAPLDRAAAIERVVAGWQRTPVVAPPDFVRGDREGFQRIGQMPPDERKAWEEKISTQGRAMKAWWMGEMIATPSPLTERMVLFWHNHFVSSFNKVRDPDLLVRQNLLFRREALGNFRVLLQEVARDPAMMKYLDTVQNRKSGPNENFAREVMELFTLGEGNYTEDDIKQAARSFAGWSVDEPSGSFKFNPGQMDSDAKTVFGRTAPMDGHAVLDLILDDPRTARFVTTKLWHELVSEEPIPAEIERISTRFAKTYDIAGLVRDLLASDAFWAAGNRGHLIKGPVDLLVGTVHSLGLQRIDGAMLADLSRRLGQDVFEPPNVRGWPGGEDWINADTVIARREILGRLLRDQDLPGAEAAFGPAWRTALFAVPPVAGDKVPHLAGAILDPAYQVK